MVFRNWEEANGGPMASQMKLNARNESGLAWGRRGFLREFFRTSADLLKRLQERCYRENEVVVAACLLANAFGVLSRIILGSAPARADTRLYTGAENGKGVRRWPTNAFPNSPRCSGTQGRTNSQLYGLFATTCGAGLFTSTWALTFWICAACSLS